MNTSSWQLFILFIVFLVLKLTGYIDWSWLWVLAPIWAPAITGFILLAPWIVNQAKKR
ncbi:MAG: hypothetical protein AAGI72_15400 [Pseudomonadota bacterium]